jgi:hypothetical protein
MRLTRVRVLLAVGLVASAATISGTALAASAAPAGSGQVVLVQCNGAGQVKPSATEQPGCMPSNELIPKLKWASWTSSAFATGVVAVNNCTPSASCGPSKFTRYPILVVLWKAAAWPSHAGRDYFTRMTIILSGSGKRAPKGVPAVQTYKLLPAQP